MKKTYKPQRACLFILALLFSFSSLGIFKTNALQNPQSGSLGLQATIPSAPPSQAATIAIPANGQTFTSTPISVSGLCPSNLIIKAFSNNVFIGSTVCSNGSYSLKVDLFIGANNLYVQDFDALGQGGPLSNRVNVTFNSAQYAQVASQVIITSSYADLGADPGQELDWPIVINGGTPPYAISTDWGDGQPASLQSSAFSGQITLKHTYTTSGIYNITVTATDTNGSTGFLQVVGIANGQISANSSGSKSSTNKNQTNSTSSIPWWLYFIFIGALIPAFWLGNHHGRSVLSKKYN